MAQKKDIKQFDYWVKICTTDKQLEEVKKIGTAIGEVRRLLEAEKNNAREWEMAIERIYDLGN